MKILIIEDEPTAARRLEKMLLCIRPEIQIMAVIDTVVDAIKYFQTSPKPDLIFTDIQLADGLSFEIFSAIEAPAPLVFTTAFDEYAIKAFKLNSIDYLLKPYKDSEVEFALQKFEQSKLSSSGELQNQLSQLLSGFKNENNFKERFLFNAGTKLIPIETADIAWFEARDKYVYAKTSSGSEYVCDDALDTLEKCINPTRFFRINRSLIVNRNHIAGIHKYFNNRLKLDLKPESKDLITVSRDRVGEFKAWLES